MEPRPAYARFWLCGMAVGLRGLLASRSRADLLRAARFMACPVDLWRYLEVAAVHAASPGHGPVLSIGSPTVASLSLAVKHTLTIAVDYAADAARELKACAGNRIALPGQADATRLPFPDKCFSFVFSVSAFEHMGGDGDSRAAREVARVLKPGGTAVLTVPMVPAYAERWIDSDPYGKQARNAEGKVFFSRYYDHDTLAARLIQPSGLSLRALHVWQERHDGWYERYCERTARPISPISIATKLLDPLWVSMRLEYVPEGAAKLRRHGLAAIVLEKLA